MANDVKASWQQHPCRCLGCQPEPRRSGCWRNYHWHCCVFGFIIWRRKQGRRRSLPSESSSSGTGKRILCLGNVHELLTTLSSNYLPPVRARPEADTVPASRVQLNTPLPLPTPDMSQHSGRQYSSNHYPGGYISSNSYNNYQQQQSQQQVPTTTTTVPMTTTRPLHLRLFFFWRTRCLWGHCAKPTTIPAARVHTAITGHRSWIRNVPQQDVLIIKHTPTFS